VSRRRGAAASLRRRVLGTFVLGSIVLAGGVSLVTYGASRTYLFRQRRTYATRQASANARLVDNLSRAPHADIPALLGSLETPAGSVPVLYEGGAGTRPGAARARRRSRRPSGGR
jgi:hypothetical protein